MPTSPRYPGIRDSRRPRLEPVVGIWGAVRASERDVFFVNAMLDIALDPVAMS